VAIVRILVIALVVVAALLAGAVAVLRARKLRRDETRERGRRLAARIAPPPSPYEISRGVRLLDGDAQPIAREQPARPRLDPERTYVFSDATPFDPDAPAHARARHDDHWALERSARRARLTPGSGRVLAIVALVLALLLALGAVIQHEATRAATTTTTSTSSTTTSTTTP
jgi:hypothetical protein